MLGTVLLAAVAAHAASRAAAGEASAARFLPAARLAAPALRGVAAPAAMLRSRRVVALEGLGLVRDAALPLAGKRVLVAQARSEDTAEVARRLVLAGARPVWCPVLALVPLADNGDLDDALMRLAEYDALVVLDAPAIEAVVARWLALADGDAAVVATMVEASGVTIAVRGNDARLFQERTGATVLPFESSGELASTLRELVALGKDGQAGMHVLVAGGRVSGEEDARTAAVLSALAAAGASVDRVDTHRLEPSPDSSVELGLLQAGAIDAIVANSAEELAALPAGAPVIVAQGPEAEAAAADLGAEVLAARGPASAVAALEQHFGSGKLLF